LVKNEAAKLLSGTKKRDNISPVFASLHWLPIKFRVAFKIILFVYMAEQLRTIFVISFSHTQHLSRSLTLQYVILFRR